MMKVKSTNLSRYIQGLKDEYQASLSRVRINKAEQTKLIEDLRARLIKLIEYHKGLTHSAESAVQLPSPKISPRLCSHLSKNSELEVS
jgi:hypothetical protein